MGEGPVADDARNLFRRAGEGDLSAQREIYGGLMEMPVEGVCSYSEAVCGAEIIARLIAAAGRVEDRLALAGLLLFRANDMVGLARTDRAEVYTAEAVAILDRLADEGNEVAAQALVVLCGSGEVSPDAMDLAKHWVSRGGAAL